VEPYRKIVEQIQNERESKETGLNDVEAALQEATLGRASSSSTNTGSNRKKGEGRNHSVASGSNNSRTNCSGSNNSRTAGNGSERSGETEQTEVSDGLAIPDFAGKRPSSRAHLVPDSECRKSHGVGCQAVCGVEFNDKGSLRDLADRMVSSPTNFFESARGPQDFVRSETLLDFCSNLYLKVYQGLELHARL